MLITIVRNYSARDVARGTLTVDGMPEMSIFTLEAGLPRNLASYVGHCLPEGEYECSCDVLPINYKGVTLRLPWIKLNEGIKWFPKARIICEDFTGLPRCGQIFLGAEHTDNGFAVDNPNDEAMKLWARVSKRAYDENEEVRIRIVNAEDIVLEDTYRDKARIAAEERAAEERRDELINELLVSDFDSQKNNPK